MILSSDVNPTNISTLQRLVEANIRVGTLACLWCLKTFCIKRLAVAFTKWKITIIEDSIYEKSLIASTTGSISHHKEQRSMNIDASISPSKRDDNNSSNIIDGKVLCKLIFS